MIARLLAKYLRPALRSRTFVSTSNHRQLLTISRRFSSSDSEETSEELIDDLKPFSVSNLLYADTKDPTIQQIKNCTSLEELKPFLENIGNLERPQVCQLVLTLSQNVHGSATPSISLDSLISRVNEVLDEMTLEEIAFTRHYLSRLKFNIRHPTMELMTDKLMPEIKKDQLFPPDLLVHFTAPMKSDKGLYSLYLEAATLPQVKRQLDNCSTAEDFNNVTLCLTNISNVLSLNLLDAYKRKTEELLDKDVLNETTPKLMMKAVNFLNFPHWSFRNGSLIRRLLLELQENIQSLEVRHLIVLSRAFQSQLESARLMPLLVKRAQELLRVSPNVALLPLAILNVTPERRVKITEVVKDFLSTYQISSNQTGETLQTIFKVLRLLKISDINLCDSFWTKTINEIYVTNESNMNYQLTKQIQKYMFFNNNLGGTYRHREFEKSMVEILMGELKNTFIPKDFATFSAFVIAYGDVVGHQSIPKFIVDKIESIHEQFTVKDCGQISRGVQIMLDSNYKRRSFELDEQLESINLSLSKSADTHLRNENLHLSELSSIFRAFTVRRATKHSFLFHKMFKLYESKIHLDLNSRTIREITYNLMTSNFRMDSICDHFIDYILNNWDHVTGDTVEKILTCCYTYSYFPEKLEVLERSSEIIVRDFNYMNGLSIVQALLALVFYKSCPQQLITMVFSSEFIKRIEQEIAMCYSKNTYPQRVMQQVMQLNRAVCLDCPEVNVKWFQQSFIEAQASKQPLIQSNVQRDINNVLLAIVKTPSFLKVNRVTPYGYRVDFELTVDQYNRFIKPLPDDYHNVNYQPNVNRIAILLLSRKMLCDNDSSRLRGSELLRMRHLEMLGFRVVHLKVNEFKVMYRSVAAKVEYIKSLLQLTA